MTYDMKMKFDAVARYESGGETFRSLGRELSIPWSTIASWVHRSRMAELPSAPAKDPSPLVEVTDEVKSVPRRIPAGPITMSINGVEISTDQLGVKAIIEAIRR